MPRTLAEVVTVVVEARRPELRELVARAVVELELEARRNGSAGRRRDVVNAGRG